MACTQQGNFILQWGGDGLDFASLPSDGEVRAGTRTVGVAQLGRALDCGSSGRGFKSRRSPHFLFTMRP